MRFFTLAALASLTACGGGETTDTTGVTTIVEETADTGSYSGPSCTSLDNFTLVWDIAFDAETNEVVDYTLDGVEMNSTVQIWWLDSTSINCTTTYDATGFTNTAAGSGDPTAITGTLSTSGAISDCDTAVICPDSFGSAGDPIASLGTTEWTMAFQETVPDAMVPYIDYWGTEGQVFGATATSPNLQGSALDYVFTGYETDPATMEADSGSIVLVEDAIDSLGLKTGVYHGEGGILGWQ
jgi:hypothetical protein